MAHAGVVLVVGEKGGPPSEGGPAGSVWLFWYGVMPVCVHDSLSLTERDDQPHASPVQQQQQLLWPVLLTTLPRLKAFDKGFFTTHAVWAFTPCWGLRQACFKAETCLAGSVCCC